MNIRPFEIALIVIFGIAGVVGLIYLSNYKTTDYVPIYGDKVEIWGTMDSEKVSELLNEVRSADKAFGVVSYVEKDERTFEQDLLNAIADGNSPDLVILPHTILATYRSKLLSIPFTTISERTFKDTYIDGAELFMRSDGILGIPIAVDPLLMYWNRDIFSSAGLSVPPKTWENVVANTTESLVHKNDQHEITQSAVAFGEYVNVKHAKDTLAMLLLQAGSSIVEEKDGAYKVTLNNGPQNNLSPGDAVFTFYGQFASPGRDTYSWNRSKNLDQTEFTNGTLAMYFGLASEKSVIEKKNSNLNYDVAPVPQGGGATTKRDYGTFYAFAIPKASKNANGAFGVAQFLSGEAYGERVANMFGLAPARRASFAKSTGDSFKDVVYQSALIARGWFDPSPNESDDVFRSMVEEMQKGQVRTRSIILDGVQELSNLF